MVTLGVKLLHHLNDPLDGKVPTKSNYLTSRKIKPKTREITLGRKCSTRDDIDDDTPNLFCRKNLD